MVGWSCKKCKDDVNLIGVLRGEGGLGHWNLGLFFFLGTRVCPDTKRNDQACFDIHVSLVTQNSSERVLNLIYTEIS